MKSATISKMHVWVLLAAMSLSSAAFAQRSRQQAQPQVQQQPMQPSNQQQVQPQGNPQMQQGQQQQQQGMPMQQAGANQNLLCGNRPLCYDANDYAVTVTEFRTSTGGNGAKILDAMLHFVNKTSQPISLGYVDQSGGAIDDMGNRYILNTYGGGVRGMGVVAGNNMDPKFTLPGGGSGDARLEFWWAPYGKLAGVNYEVEFSIREMNRVEGNQWTLGDEALIHYQGLANGVGVAPVSGNAFASGAGGMGSGGMATGGGNVVSSMGSAVSSYVPGAQANNSAPMAQTTYVAAGQPCPPGTTASSNKAANIANAVGQQNQTANNAISNASSAISSFGSIFKKKSAQAANAPASTTPCVAVTNTAAPMASPAANPATNSPTKASVNPAVRSTNGAVVPANNANVSATQPRTANTVLPATAVQRTTANTAARPATAQQPARTVNNAALKQPVNTTAKPSPAKATTKATTNTATTNAQGN